MLIKAIILLHMNSVHQRDPGDIVVYSYRWLILFLFCFLEIANALMWVSFAPISDIASHYFGGGTYGSVAAPCVPATKPPTATSPRTGRRT